MTPNRPTAASANAAPAKSASSSAFNFGCAKAVETKSSKGLALATATPGSTSLTARLTIGKRVSDRVYLTFSRSLGTTINDQIVLLEYEESDRLSWILSRNEDSQTYALEFRVRHVF